MTGTHPPILDKDEARNAEQEIKELKEGAAKHLQLAKRAQLLSFLHVCLLTFGVVGGYIALGFKIKGELFGYTRTLKFSGIHSPGRTQAEFEAEFIKRLSERGYHVGSIQIIRETQHKQFDGEVTLINVYGDESGNRALLVLREVSDSMEDQKLPAEK